MGTVVVHHDRSGGVLSSETTLSPVIEVRIMEDQVLLAQYIATSDSGAFEELTRRYAGLVKGVCHRVLGNTHDAEEVAQECFLELARDASHVHSSVAGWLHRAATTRSLNALRSRSRRKVRERECSLATETNSTITDVTIQELRRVIDGALTSMPEDLRLPMILHFLDGWSQRDVALELGVNQSTISRRMRDALRQLRERLTQAGYAASVPAVMVAMQNQADAVTESTIVTVTVAGAAGKAAGSMTIAGAIKASLAATLPLLSFLLFGGWMSLLVALSVVTYIARFQPLWVSEVFASLGVKDVYDQPSFSLTRWNWNQPPRGWRAEVQVSLICSVVFLGLCLVFALGTRQPPWGTVVLGAVAAGGSLAHALRIVHRVKRTIARHPGQQTGVIVSQQGNGFWRQMIGFPSNPAMLTWFDTIQLMVIGLVSVIVAGYVVAKSGATNLWPSVVLSGITGGGMLAWGCCILRRLICGCRPANDDSSSGNESPGRWHATQGVLAIGATTVATLTIWILWNPAAVRGIALSLAAVQTSILGWLVYRLAARCQRFELRYLRRAVIAVLVSCLVLNSGVCLANLLQSL